MSVISMAGRRLWMTAVAMGLVIALGYTVSQGATARPAKDVAEQSRAVTASAQYLQGNGFTDPMVSAENIDNRLLTVTVDNKGWTRMSKAQKMEFLERVNGSALSANGGIARFKARSKANTSGRPRRAAADPGSTNGASPQASTQIGRAHV